MTSATRPKSANLQKVKIARARLSKAHSMSKRRADVQITHDDREDEEDDGPVEQPGPWKKASDEELAKRKFVRLKRPSAGAAGGAQPEVQPAVVNPFSGFSGLTGAKTAAAPPASASEAPSLNGLNAAFAAWVEHHAQTNPPTTFLAACEDYTTFAKKISPSTRTVPVPAALAAPVPAAAAKPAPAPEPAQAKIVAPAPAKVEPTASVKPMLSITAPAPHSSGAGAPAPFSFAAPSSTSATTGAAFSFSAAAAPAAASAAASAAAPAAGGGIPGFSFAAPLSLSASNLAAFAPKPAASGPASAFPPLSGIFSGGLIPTIKPGLGPGESAALFGSSAAGAGAGEEDDDEGLPIEEPERVERNKNDKDVILLEKSCKLHRLSAVDGGKAGEKEWKDLGKGTLRVTADPDTKKKRILVRNTMGVVILNASFFKGQKFEKTNSKKNNSLSFNAVVSVKEYETTHGPDGEEQRQVDRTGLHSFMMAVGKSELDAVISTLNDAVKGLG